MALSIDEKIKKAEIEVQKAEEKYKNAKANLETLLKKKADEENKAVLEAIKNSKKSTEEILKFLESEK